MSAGPHTPNPRWRGWAFALFLVAPAARAASGSRARPRHGRDEPPGRAPLRLRPPGRSRWVRAGGRLRRRPPGREATPPRQLTRGFWMGRTEVTVEAFRKFVDETGRRTTAEMDGWSPFFDGQRLVTQPGLSWRDPGFAQGPTHPVVDVSWYDAEAFCAWSGGRLPTEAEWEHGARAGVRGRKYVWGDDPVPPVAGVKQANVADEATKRVYTRWTIVPRYDDGHTYTAPAGTFAANGFGLHDMEGNAAEWCADWHDERYYASVASRSAASQGAEPARDPGGPPRETSASCGAAPGSTTRPFSASRAATSTRPRPTTPSSASAAPGTSPPARPPSPRFRRGSEAPDRGRLRLRPGGLLRDGLRGRRPRVPGRREAVPPGRADPGLLAGPDGGHGRGLPGLRRATAYRTSAEADGWSRVFDGRSLVKKEGASWQSPGFEQGPDHPAVHVSWYDAWAYCAWSGGRLPTEAEFESSHAPGAPRRSSLGRRARADRGWRPAGERGRRSPEAPPRERDARRGIRRRSRLHVAGRGVPPERLRPPRRGGERGRVVPRLVRREVLHPLDRSRPPGAPFGLQRVIRGGSWLDDASNLRASYRVRDAPAYHDALVGFRCARDVPPPQSGEPR